jgi:glutathione S-transferase
VFESRLTDRVWLAGDAFTIADCAAAPALFYCRAVHPWGDRPELERYFRAAIERPSVARVIDEARPYRALFPPGWPDDFDA